MAALNFPSSPTLNQVYTANGYSWKWNGASWISLPTINGGTINGTTIGSTTPASGAFTTLNANGQLTVTGAAQNAFGSAFTPTAWGVSSIDINHASGGLLGLYYGGSPKGYFIALSGGGIGVNTQGAGTLDFNVNGTQRAQISGTGLAVTGSVSDSKGEIRLIPQNSQSAAYTLVLSDAGKHILHPAADTTARTFTIPANSSVAYPVGTAITFVNQNAGGTVTIAITSDTMRLAGAGTTGSRTLAANGVATALKITSTEWIISGTGLT